MMPFPIIESGVSHLSHQSTSSPHLPRPCVPAERESSSAETAAVFLLVLRGRCVTGSMTAGTAQMRRTAVGTSSVIVYKNKITKILLK